MFLIKNAFEKSAYHDSVSVDDKEKQGTKNIKTTKGKVIEQLKY
jgi:hypothetical protein